MKRITFIVALIVLTLGAPKPAAAENRYIVRSTGGLSSVLNLCNLLKCNVQGGLDGPVGQTFLVTSTNNLLANLVNGKMCQVWKTVIRTPAHKNSSPVKCSGPQLTFWINPRPRSWTTGTTQNSD